MMSVELGNIAKVIEDSRSNMTDLVDRLRSYQKVISDAVWNNTLTQSGIFAYETDGYGGQIIMDDANVPSLVSLPYLGFLERNDPTYIKTKEMLFTRANPYYAVGKKFSGIG